MSLIHDAHGWLVISVRALNQRIVATRGPVRFFNMFSEGEIVSRSDHVDSGRVRALFGVPRPLAELQPDSEAELDVFVAFAGAEVRVPEAST